MTEWSKHVHRFAKKHNMSYKQANRSRKCKETYKKRKTSPRRRRMNANGMSDDDKDLLKTEKEKTRRAKEITDAYLNEEDKLLDELYHGRITVKDFSRIRRSLREQYGMDD